MSGTYTRLNRNGHIYVISVKDNVYTIVCRIDQEDEDIVQLIIDLEEEFERFNNGVKTG